MAFSSGPPLGAENLSSDRPASLRGAATTLLLARNVRKGGEARKGPPHLNALDAAGEYADL
jgi:hypothetical protein